MDKAFAYFMLGVALWIARDMVKAIKGFKLPRRYKVNAQAAQEHLTQRRKRKHWQAIESRVAGYEHWQKPKEIGERRF